MNNHKLFSYFPHAENTNNSVTSVLTHVDINESFNTSAIAKNKGFAFHKSVKVSPILGPAQTNVTKDTSFKKAPSNSFIGDELPDLVRNSFSRVSNFYKYFSQPSRLETSRRAI